MGLSAAARSLGFVGRRAARPRNRGPARCVCGQAADRAGQLLPVIDSRKPYVYTRTGLRDRVAAYDGSVGRAEPYLGHVSEVRLLRRATSEPSDWVRPSSWAVGPCGRGRRGSRGRSRVVRVGAASPVVLMTLSSRPSSSAVCRGQGLWVSWAVSVVALTRWCRRQRAVRKWSRALPGIGGRPAGEFGFRYRRIPASAACCGSRSRGRRGPGSCAPIGMAAGRPARRAPTVAGRLPWSGTPRPVSRGCPRNRCERRTRGTPVAPHAERDQPDVCQSGEGVG